MFNFSEHLFDLDLTIKQKKDLYYCLLESYNQRKIILCEDQLVNNLVKIYCKNYLYIDPWTFEIWGMKEQD